MTPTVTEDLKKVTDKLSEFVKSARGKQRKQGKGGIGSWVWGLLIGLIGLAALAFLWHRANARGKEIAKLKHSKDLHEQEALRKRTMEAVVASEEKVDQLLLEAAEDEQKALAIGAAIVEVEKRQKDDIKAILEIKNWRDFDRHLSGK